ncbi:hypothetical protein [Vibrio parahaemolyticus]|uniref:hypothetical protein n=1 Tax=Vibrio parahaemolyticus TaxID=670 RepID=UPI001120111D|nr:hypothetical protein [Vibrio parahaemolyticus]TOI38959.1 hypothetical protein CGI60_23530 [Vibrio parahaemolyticus]HBC3911322.1 hypothetical protein [Vibrio parahaemolyticus]
MYDLHNIIETISERLYQQNQKIIGYSQTGSSYEEWLNWEIFDALKSSGFVVQPKPSYRNYGSLDSGRFQADIYAKSPDNRTELIFEVALVGDATQNKWRNKIEKDRSKLSNFIPHHENLLKIQLVILIADYPELLKVWSGWLSKIKFWDGHSRCTVTKSTELGEMVLCYWQVET